jgi:hypothetical protein
VSFTRCASVESVKAEANGVSSGHLWCAAACSLDEVTICRGPENDVHTRAAGLRLILFSKDIGAFEV